MTVRGLAKRARISSGTFYKYYSSADDCLLCTFDHICGIASRRLIEAGQKESEPRRRLALAVIRLFQDMAADPQAATFMLRAAPTVGPAFTTDLWNSAMQLGGALEFCIRGDDGPPLHPLLLEGLVAGLARIGGSMGPTAGEVEVREAAIEAVEWIMSLCMPAVPEAELPVVTVPPERGDGLPAPGRLRDDDWEGPLGDERAMILAAAFRIAKSGYHQLSIRRICQEAGVSRRDFNRHFESLEDAFIAALEERAARAIDASVGKHDASAAWSRTVCEALRTLCEAIEDDRDSARVIFIDITAAGTKGIDSNDRLISKVAHALRTTAPPDQCPSELAAEASTAAAWAILRRRVQDQAATTSAALPVLALLMFGRGDRKRTAGDENESYPLLAFP